MSKCHHLDFNVDANVKRELDKLHPDRSGTTKVTLRVNCKTCGVEFRGLMPDNEVRQIILHLHPMDMVKRIGGGIGKVVL